MTSVATSRGELRRSSILDATLRVIALEGVRAVTHRRVAAEAEAAVGLITYHFSSTESLIAATLDVFAADEAAQMERLQARILASSGGAEELTEILVAEVAERSGSRRDRALAGLALTLEIPRLTIDRDGFERWELAQTEAYAALLAVLGLPHDGELVDFIEATLEGLYLYAMISREPETVTAAARAGLRRLLGALIAGERPSRAGS